MHCERVNATDQDVQSRICELNRKVKTGLKQVVVEAIIVEISETLARELGVQWLVGGKDVPFAVTNFSNASLNIVDVAGGLLADHVDTTLSHIHISDPTEAS